jgi:hypothetical protein
MPGIFPGFVRVIFFFLWPMTLLISESISAAAFSFSASVS